MGSIGAHATVTGGLATGGLAHPELADVPFVVETPGGKAGHARDIATLKGLRGTDAAGRGKGAVLWLS
jgi:deoxyribonuclease-4